jgi:hypothetical protein
MVPILSCSSRNRTWPRGFVRLSASCSIVPVNLMMIFFSSTRSLPNVCVHYYISWYTGFLLIEMADLSSTLSVATDPSFPMRSTSRRDRHMPWRAGVYAASQAKSTTTFCFADCRLMGLRLRAASQQHPGGALVVVDVPSYIVLDWYVRLRYRQVQLVKIPSCSVTR